MAQKKYRVLRDLDVGSASYKPDAVIMLDEGLGQTYVAAGALDGAKAAVEYAESLAPKVEAKAEEK